MSGNVVFCLDMTKKKYDFKAEDAEPITIQFRKSSLETLIGGLLSKIEAAGVPVKKLEIERTEDLYAASPTGSAKAVSVLVKATFGLVVDV